MANTLRPKNVCNDCGYPWYPRGKDLSIKCPKCGSDNVRYSREGWIGAIVIVAVLAFSGLSKSFKKPAHQPESFNTLETTQLSNIAGSESEVADPRENSEPTLESEQPTQQVTSVEEIQAEVTDNSSENRSVFYQWSESELKLREIYTRVLNDSNTSSTELESRRTQYLLFVNNKNKKCGDLTPKISSNLNSDVSTITFNNDEMPILKCHIEENKSQISEVSSVEN